MPAVRRRLGEVAVPCTRCSRRSRVCSKSSRPWRSARMGESQVGVAGPATGFDHSRRATAGAPSASPRRAPWRPSSPRALAAMAGRAAELSWWSLVTTGRAADGWQTVGVGVEPHLVDAAWHDVQRSRVPHPDRRRCVELVEPDLLDLGILGRSRGPIFNSTMCPAGCRRFAVCLERRPSPSRGSLRPSGSRRLAGVLLHLRLGLASLSSICFFSTVQRSSMPCGGVARPARVSRGASITYHPLRACSSRCARSRSTLVDRHLGAARFRCCARQLARGRTVRK